MERKLIAEAESKELQNERARIDFKTYKKEHLEAIKSTRNNNRGYTISALVKVLDMNPALSSISAETKRYANEKLQQIINSIEV
jgi:molecular chaperone GrpE (heat shock protein)